MAFLTRTPILSALFGMRDLDVGTAFWGARCERSVSPIF